MWEGYDDVVISLSIEKCRFNIIIMKVSFCSGCHFNHLIFITCSERLTCSFRTLNTLMQPAVFTDVLSAYNHLVSLSEIINLEFTR